jgi:GH35 family endo-1,4-beta-xylanase
MSLMDLLFTLQLEFLCSIQLDVMCPEPCTATDLQKQAQVYAAVLRACLANKPSSGLSTAGNRSAAGAASGCKSFETWGFTDKVSWLNGPRCKPTSGA